MKKGSVKELSVCILERRTRRLMRKRLRTDEGANTAGLAGEFFPSNQARETACEESVYGLI